MISRILAFQRAFHYFKPLLVEVFQPVWIQLAKILITAAPIRKVDLKYGLQKRLDGIYFLIKNIHRDIRKVLAVFLVDILTAFQCLLQFFHGDRPHVSIVIFFVKGVDGRAACQCARVVILVEILIRHPLNGRESHEDRESHGGNQHNQNPACFQKTLQFQMKNIHVQHTSLSCRAASSEK